MKSAYVVAAVLAVCVPAAAAELDVTAIQLWDVVHTADGSVLKGVIVEEVPGVSVRIVIAGGTSLVVALADVTRFTKELNPAFANGPVVHAAAAAAAGAPAPARPVRVATEGLRFGVMPGFAQHTAADASTFFLTARAGWELAFDQWGLTPGVVIDFTPDASSYDYDGVGIMASARAAYRGSSISPFVGFGLGGDVVGSDTSLATFMGAGIELLVHRRMALTAEAKFHRGWAGTYVKTLSFGAVGMGVEVRL